MKLKYVLSVLATSFSLSAMASTNPALIIYHRQGTAPMDDIGVKIMTIDGVPCYQKDDYSKFTQRLIIKEDELKCPKQEAYAVYAATGYLMRYLYVSDTYPHHGGSCTITHDKDGWWSSKLTIKCINSQ